MGHSTNHRILCAYALLFTFAAGIIALDPVRRHHETHLADVAIPTPKAFESKVPLRRDPLPPQRERLAKR